VHAIGKGQQAATAHVYGFASSQLQGLNVITSPGFQRVRLHRQAGGGVDEGGITRFGVSPDHVPDGARESGVRFPERARPARRGASSPRRFCVLVSRLLSSIGIDSEFRDLKRLCSWMSVRSKVPAPPAGCTVLQIPHLSDGSTRSRGDPRPCPGALRG